MEIPSRRRRPRPVPRPRPRLPDGPRVIDGDEGLVVLDPRPADPGALPPRPPSSRGARFKGLAGLSGLPADTLDGVAIGLWGNIEFPAEVAACLERGAVGVGLYRTEFLYMNADRPPTEQEQYEAYAAVARSLEGRPVTIRTLDLGHGDKLVSYQTTGYAEPEPGARPAEPPASRSATPTRCSGPSASARSCGASAYLGDVRVMFPLVSTLTEFRQARALLDEVAAELAAEGVARSRTDYCPSASWSRCPPPPSWPTSSQRRWISSRSVPMT